VGVVAKPGAEGVELEPTKRACGLDGIGCDWTDMRRRWEGKASRSSSARRRRRVEDELDEIAMASRALRPAATSLVA
jgi:hypothetical protein